MRTNAGADFQAQALSTTGAQPAPATYIALTANATAPALTDTTLTGEITTGGGGLVRAQAVFAHTTSATTYTLTKTFTANGSDSLPVTLAKEGVLNAASVGTLVWESLFPQTATLAAVGDACTVTVTVSM